MDRGNHEIHLTVESCGLDQDAFVCACATIGAKPVLIVLSSATSTSDDAIRMPRQLMTSTWNVGTLDDAITRATSQIMALTANGFTVVRMKIETGATHPGTPITIEDALSRPPNQYYEFHAKVVVAREKLESLVTIAKIAEATRGHMSRNAFRVSSDSSEIRFVTWRMYRTPRDVAISAAMAGVDALNQKGFEVVSMQREYAWIDTNTKCDAGWIDECQSIQNFDEQNHSRSPKVCPCPPLQCRTGPCPIGTGVT